MRATYSPEDNKIRLYPSTKFDAETLAKLKAVGFRWAPKQKLFFVPAWTPASEDLAEALAGDIEAEDTSMMERAEVRAERFTHYSTVRAEESGKAQNAVRAIADQIPFGQPILVGHHSERRAMADAERMNNGMRRAVQLWKTSQYWEERAASALVNAEYRERPDVRYRRIKSIEADLRKAQRETENAKEKMAAWGSETLDPDQALDLALQSYIYRRFPVAQYPNSKEEGKTSIYNALASGVIDFVQARALCLNAYENTIRVYARWISHYQNRLTYERAMLGDLAGERFDIQAGGQVLIRGEWLKVVRVTKRAGKVMSVTTDAKFVRVRSIEEVKDYKAPSTEAAAAAAKAGKLGPLCNYPGDGFMELTSEEWERRRRTTNCTHYAKVPAQNGNGAHRRPVSFVPGAGKLAPVYITDKKRVDPPKVAPENMIGN